MLVKADYGWFCAGHDEFYECPVFSLAFAEFGVFELLIFPGGPVNEFYIVA